MKEVGDKKELIGNAQLTITFLRHSTKGPKGNLSEEGRKKAEGFEMATELNSIIEIYASDIQRSIETAKILSGRLRIAEPVIAPILSEHPYTDEKIEELGLSGGKWLLVEKASRFLAGKIAIFTVDQLKSKKLNEKRQIIAISHVPPIMSFLGHVLAYAKNKSSIDEEIKSELFGFFEGFVKPLEGFKMVFFQEKDTRAGYLEVTCPGGVSKIPYKF